MRYSIQLNTAKNTYEIFNSTKQIQNTAKDTYEIFNSTKHS